MPFCDACPGTLVDLLLQGNGFASSKIHTWTIVTTAGSPAFLCLHLSLPSATTGSPSVTNCSGTSAKSSPIAPVA